MPRTAAEQALTGPQVPLDRLQPGDLLFWAYDPNDPGFVDHVAIYAGNGMMVVAPMTGQLVQIARVNTDRLVGAIEVNPAGR
jgi:cell wall-associated NlpC family hydrolase